MPFKRHGQCLKTFVFVTTQGAPGVWWMEARDPAQHSAMHRRAPTTKNCLAPNVTGAEVGHCGLYPNASQLSPGRAALYL